MKKRFAAALIAAATMACMVLPTIAETILQTIDVYTGVKVLVDDKQLNAGDTHGNPEAFIYNGTTYVAVAAISNSLGEPVKWEGKTRTVYIGDHASEGETFDWLKDTEYFYYKGDAFTNVIDYKDNLGEQHINCVSGQNVKEVYNLNAQYSRFTGTMFLRYDAREKDFGEGNTAHGMKVYGDGELLYELHPEGQGFRPVAFDIDIEGVLELTIEFNGASVALFEYALCIGEGKLIK